MGMPKSFIRKAGRFWRGAKSRSYLRNRAIARLLRPRQWLSYGRRALSNLRRRLSQAQRLTYDFNATGNGQPCSKNHRQSQRTRAHGRLVLVLALVSLTAAMSYPLLSQPLYGVGETAPQDIRAPFDATVSDQRGTEDRRKDARNGVVPVLSEDSEITNQIIQDLQRSLKRGDEIRQLSEPFPIVSTSALSEPSQILLRNLTPRLWRSLQSQLQRRIFEASWWVQEAGPEMSTREGDVLNVLRQTAQTLERLQNQWPSEGIVRLDADVALRRDITFEDRSQSLTYRSLDEFLKGVDRARDRYQQAIATLEQVPENGSNQSSSGQLNGQLLNGHPDGHLNVQPLSKQPFNKTLLSLSPPQWKAVKDASNLTIKRLLVHGLPPGLTDDHLDRVISTVLEDYLDSTLRPVAQDILVAVTSDRHNLVQDDDKTQELAAAAVEEIDLITVSRRRRELIVQANETITSEQFALLDHYGLSRRGINWRGLVDLSGLITVSLGGFWVVERRFGQRLRRPDHIVLLVLAVSVPLSAWASTLLPDTWEKALVINLPLVGLLTGSFYGPAVGSVLCILLGIVMPLALDLDWTTLIAMTAAGVFGAMMAGRLRSREEFAFLGLGIGFIQGSTYLLLSLINSAAASSVWVALLGAAVFHGVTGLVWSVVALGLSPYLEHLFDLVTPIRLAELSNPNRSLLKRLASEAPGTFQHTMFVASLAEAAARALGCNVELVRAGTLYHDIGKMHDPLGFIENQMGGPNKHDIINDPWKSAEIIKRHVSEGIVMAKKARLPKAIQAFIPEHQGTMCISYFYHQAMQAAQTQAGCVGKAEIVGSGTGASVVTAVRSQPVCEADFRYDGPVPQSRETGIVMLADSCEAALRSLKEATYEEAFSMGNRILRARWVDNQLVDSGLTRPEMTKIAEVFVRVWQQVNHQRIAYPKAALPK
ncbi:MAG: HD family phosphohydrolase [Cyanophyceae cyanobacterium]